MDKILLVDDVKLLREIQKGFLASSLVDILTAGDGHEALEVARKSRPDLIVMDKFMPGMDGVTCCREIRRDPLLKDIPVIMLTNAAQPADAEEYRAAGFNDCLAKPIDGKLFLATIKKYLPAIERRAIRVPFSAAVTIVRFDGDHAGISRDISLNGMHVESGLQMLPGEELQVSFTLPGGDAPVEVRGRVAWLDKRAPSGKAAFGVEFLEVTGKGIPFLRKSELKTFIERLSQR